MSCRNHITLRRPSSKVLSIKDLLRRVWSSSAFLRGCVDETKPFLVADDGSKAHLERINDLMKSDYYWSLISIICLLAQQAELIGSWSEGCPCHPPPRHVSSDQRQNIMTTEHMPVSDDPNSGAKQRRRRRKPVQTQAQRESKKCPFRCCRAPELAMGHAMRIQREFAKSHHSRFLESVSHIPTHQRGELISAWSIASSKLQGLMALAIVL